MKKYERGKGLAEQRRHRLIVIKEKVKSVLSKKTIVMEQKGKKD